MPVDYPGAIDMLLPTSYTFDSVAPLSIVDHCTGGDMTLDSLHQTFLATMRSAHFGIGRDGSVAQFVQLSRGAGGNCCPDRDANGNLLCNPYWFPYVQQYGNLNFCTISIEHCNDSNNSLPLTPAQQDASNKLNLWLCEKFGLTTDHIHSHKSINPIAKPNCPGSAFDFNQLFNYINTNRSTSFMEQSILDHWNSYFKSLQGLFPTANIKLPRSNTGIFRTYHDLYLKGHELGPATSYEYQSVDFGGVHVICQDFGSMRIVWVPSKGPLGVYGPYGSVALQ